MKGLLLKDLYMSKYYFKTYLLVVVLFLVISGIGNDNMFFAIYPSMLAGIISVSLCSYDEMSKWNVYSGTLPYSKKQMVTAKYLIGVMFQVIVLIMAAISQIVRMNIEGSFNMDELVTFLLLLIILSCISGAFCLPWVFKFGVEKGRLVNYIQIGFICGLGAFFSTYFRDVLAEKLQYNMIVYSSSFSEQADVLAEKMQYSVIIGLLCAASVIVYVISWYISVLFYKKREI